MKKYKNIVIYGNAKWQTETSGNSAQQLSCAFFDLGYRVIFIPPHKSPPIILQKHLHEFVHVVEEPRVLGKKIAGLLKKIRFGGRPLSQTVVFKKVYHRYFLSLLKPLERILKQWEANPTNTVFICSYCNPKALEVLTYFKKRKYKIVYRHVDWFDASYRKFGFRKNVLKRACQAANLITISHPELYKNLPKIRTKIVLAQNGVNLGIFNLHQEPRPKPLDLICGQITVGFWGTFWNNRLDWDLIRFLAARNPGWQFNLIADLEYLDIQPETLPPNVHLLGSKEPSRLPSYLHYFDVCLIPYRQDLSFAKYANPIKALEYLSGLKPIVTSHNKSLEHYPGVYFYSSLVDAEKMIVKAKNTKLEGNTILPFLESNSWEKRANGLIKELNNL